MTIYRDATLDSHGVARLADDPADGESPWQGIELQRRIGTRGEQAEPFALFDLTIYCGGRNGIDDDLSFHGMSPHELRGLGETLIRLAREEPDDRSWDTPEVVAKMEPQSSTAVAPGEN